MGSRTPPSEDRGSKKHSKRGCQLQGSRGLTGFLPKTVAKQSLGEKRKIESNGGRDVILHTIYRAPSRLDYKEGGNGVQGRDRTAEKKRSALRGRAATERFLYSDGSGSNAKEGPGSEAKKEEDV